MRKSFFKYLYGLLISGFLVAFVLIGVYISKEDSTLAFNIQTGAEEKQLYPFVNEKGEYYVFLPSYTDLNKVTIVTSDDSEIVLNGKDALDGMKCDVYEPNQAYDIVIDGQNTKITFMKSANVATLFLDTASGNMDYIHTDKNNEEYARMVLLDENGYVDYSDEMCTVKGRGNSTWLMNKKPYSFTLSEESSLLGLGKSFEWVLLANSWDESNLNNKIALDMAKQTSSKWEPEAQYTDIYLNGEYNGLYLLVSKIGTEENKIGINTNNEDFLCTVETKTRWDSLNNPFVSSMGRTIEISNPVNVDYRKKSYIESMVNHMEQMITTGIFEDEFASFDVESWVHRYLVDEISANVDADSISSYFYYTNATYFGGPVWDYDLTFGSYIIIRNPRAFYAKGLEQKDIGYFSYNNTLYQNKHFYTQIVEIYEEKFLPLLENYIDEEIQSLSEKIAKSSEMNSIRWRKAFDNAYASGRFYRQCSDTIISFLKERVAFLNSVWLENKKTFSLRFEVTEKNYFVVDSILVGGSLKDSIYYHSDEEWVDSKTGETINPDKPITKDMILVKKQSDAEQLTTVDEGTDTRVFIAIMSGMLLIGFLIVAVVIDTARRKKERRNICD